ncbi:MAG: hypothetical protein IJ341_03700 [Bacteroidales bacterium]|nr:hypothetical protein [Bacteroidales bacterium]
MANKRNLKKEINFIAEELIASCLLSGAFMSGNNDEKIDELIGRTLDLQVEFLSRINHPNGTKDTKLVKGYYKALIADFDKKVEEILNELEALNK